MWTVISSDRLPKYATPVYHAKQEQKVKHLHSISNEHLESKQQTLQIVLSTLIRLQHSITCWYQQTPDLHVHTIYDMKMKSLS